MTICEFFLARTHGKTSLLRAVNLLGDIDFGRYSPSFICKICIESLREESVDSVAGSIGERDKYLTKTNVGAIFGFDKSEIEKILPTLSERQNNILNSFDKAQRCL